MSVPDYGIGARLWPGISKLIEEMGEVHQVIGKLQAVNGSGIGWDGTNLHTRLEDELGDVIAAIAYIRKYNSMDLHNEKIRKRAQEKFRIFEKWHEEAAPL